MSKLSTSSLTGFCESLPSKNGTARGMKPFTGIDPFDAQIIGCRYGHYPWDYWKKEALSAGVSGHLAGLGRLAMREAWKHHWEPNLQSLCGWADNGKRMIRLALRSPETARKRWDRLLESDGNRGYYDTKTWQWISYI